MRISIYVQKKSPYLKVSKTYHASFKKNFQKTYRVLDL